MENDSPDIVVHPMIIIVVFILVCSVLKRLWPLEIPELGLLEYAGYALMGIGGIAVVLSGREFSKRKTGTNFVSSAKSLVTSGLYRFSRNPMYVSFIVIFIGFSLQSNNLWFLVLTLPLAVAFRQLVIVREEAYLTGKFPEEYGQYKRTVRRWL